MNPVTLALVTRAFFGQVWALTPEMHGVMESILLERLDGYKPSTNEIKARVDGTTYGSSSGEAVGTGIAVINLHGVMMSRIQAMESLSGGSTPQRFANLVRAAADDPEIGTIVLSIDSPGGAVSGTGLAAEAVADAATKKKVIAVVDDMACSAACWIAVQATEVVIPTSGTIGSISVIMAHLDRREQYTKAGVKPTVLRTGVNKALGQDTEALTPAVRAKLEGDMQKYHDLFVGAVAAGRHQTPEYVQANWASGDTWVGEEAVTVGLADRIGTLATVLAELRSPDPGDAPEDAPPTDLYINANPTPTAVASAQADPAGDPPPEAPPTDPPTDPPAADPAEPPPPDAGAAASASHVQEGHSMNIAAISAKLSAGQPLTAEENTFLQAHLAKQGAASAAPAAAAATPTPTAAAGQPDTSTWPPEARAAFEGLNARLTVAEQTASTERNIRLQGHFEGRARALGQPNDFAATLRSAHDKLSKDEYEAFEAGLARGAAARGGLLDERGNGASASSADVTAELNTRAQALMAADTRLTLVAAQKQVFAADPAFAQRYNEALR